MKAPGEPGDGRRRCGSEDALRILTITGLFPSRVQPLHGTFMLERVKAIAGQGHEVRVVAPVPWVPPGPVPRRHRPCRSVPAAEVVEGIAVEHPRFVAFPKLVRVHGHAYARGIRRPVARLATAFQPDLLDVNYLFPDGVGAAQVARDLRLPYVCTARGSDVKYFGRRRPFRRPMRRALAGAAAVHAVSADLAGEMRARGLFHGPIHVVPNGVDPEVFRPRDRAEARRRLDLPGSRPIAICVAHFVPEHRQRLVLRALRHPAAPRPLLLLLLGDGVRRPALARLVARLGLDDRVRLIGPVPHRQVALWLAASNLCVLVSAREGCPNVVLEASACGIPCLLSDLPEMREVLGLGHRGWLVPPEEAAIARAMSTALEAGAAGCRGPDRPSRTWDEVAAEVAGLFAAVLTSGAGRAPSAGSRGAAGRGRRWADGPP